MILGYVLNFDGASQIDQFWTNEISLRGYPIECHGGDALSCYVW